MRECAILEDVAEGEDSNLQKALLLAFELLVNMEPQMTAYLQHLVALVV